MATPRADSLTVVQQYVRNSRAVLDSLNRFEFLKLRYSTLTTRLNTAETRINGLTVQVSAANARTATEAAARQRAETRLGRQRAELWTYRGLAALAALKLTADLLHALR